MTVLHISFGIVLLSIISIQCKGRQNPNVPHKQPKSGRSPQAVPLCIRAKLAVKGWIGPQGALLAL